MPYRPEAAIFLYHVNNAVDDIRSCCWDEQSQCIDYDAVPQLLDRPNFIRAIQAGIPGHLLLVCAYKHLRQQEVTWPQSTKK